MFELQLTISFAKIILNAIRPGIETLGRLPGTNMFCDVDQYPMAITSPGVLIVRVKSALLCFANANFVRERYAPPPPPPPPPPPHYQKEI